ncbi:MAG TPA: copper homeostasis protein CutC [Terracidiphilus sp.]
MKSLSFELCVQTLESACAAQAGGADQVELCAGLSGGGITPLSEVTAAVVRAVSIPVSVLIRPRYGDFAFSSEEYDLMCRQIGEAREAGAAAVAVGVLLRDGRIDVARTSALVDLARPMKVTFHRAFDEAPDLFTALDDVIATGADCLLTSGGHNGVLAGAATIASLSKHAGNRLRLMAGGGLRLENLAEVVLRSGVTMLHSSLTRANGTHSHRNGDGRCVETGMSVLTADVCEAIRLFHEAFQARAFAAPPAE